MKKNPKETLFHNWIMKTTVTVKRLAIITPDAQSFIDELEALCKKYGGVSGENWHFTWDTQE